MRLGRGQEDVDLVDLRPLLERGLEAALVWDEDAHRDLLGHVDAREHLGRVGELGYHVGAHEARDLDAAQAGARERVYELDLALGGDDLGLVLKAVAWPHLSDAHALGRRWTTGGRQGGHVAHLTTSRGRR